MPEADIVATLDQAHAQARELLISKGVREEAASEEAWKLLTTWLESLMRNLEENPP